MTHKQDD